LPCVEKKPGGKSVKKTAPGRRAITEVQGLSHAQKKGEEGENPQGEKCSTGCRDVNLGETCLLNFLVEIKDPRSNESREYDG